jgi:PAS domain S-box-containing protein
VAAAAAARSVLVDRRDKYDEATRNTQNLTRVLAEHLEGSIRLIDLALDEAKVAVERPGSRLPAPDQETESTFVRLHAQVPFLDAIRAADARGRIIAGGTAPGTATVEIGDRDYFLGARDRPGEDLVVSAPLVSRITGKRSLVFARAVHRPDGAFGGIVYAVVAMDQFTRVLGTVDVGKMGAVVLRDATMAVTARYPKREESARSIGDRSISPTLAAALESGRDAGVFVATSPVDRLEKVTAFRRVAGGAFLLIVAAASSDFLSEWRGGLLQTGVATVVFFLLTALAGWLLLRAWARESESRFRALVDGAPIAVSVARNGRVLYVNDAFARSFGLPSAEAAVGRSILDSLPPEDAARTAERLDRRQRGLPVEPTTEITLRRPDGTTFQAAVTDATVDLADGRAVIAFIQDVTERRRSEAERERLIGDLQRALADVKTLRGLLPICAHCKKIRDDRGYWNRIETFIRARSEAEFTHGICPDCAREFYPDDAQDDEAEAGGGAKTPR